MLIEPSPTPTSEALHAQQRVGWQPSRILADRAEAERAFALAEHLGSVTRPPPSWAPLGRRSVKPSPATAWACPPPTPKPSASGIAAACQHSGQPVTHAGPGVYRRQPQCAPGAAADTGRALPVGPPRRGVRHPGRQGRRRAEQRTPGLPAHHPAWAIIRRAERAHRHPATSKAVASAGGPTMPPAATAPADPTNPRRGGWLPLPADRTPPRTVIDGSGQLVLVAA
jgi:hypothetical protein